MVGRGVSVGTGDNVGRGVLDSVGVVGRRVLVGAGVFVCVAGYARFINSGSALLLKEYSYGLLSITRLWEGGSSTLKSKDMGCLNWSTRDTKIERNSARHVPPAVYVCPSSNFISMVAEKSGRNLKVSCIFLP